jgi:uncharacterized protein YlzI (FlbEa/FlbD family)
MVQFTDPSSGNQFSLNPAEISSVIKFWTGGCEIKMKNGTTFYTKEEYDKVLEILKKAGGKP